MSYYKDFKRRVGLSSNRPAQPQQTIDPNSDEGKLEHFRNKLPGFHERLKKLPEFDQKAGTLLFYFQEAIEAKKLPDAEKNHGLLMDRIKEVELPMYNDLEQLRSKATTFDDWTQKVAGCEKFLATYTEYGKECAEVKDILANAKKQPAVVRYAKQAKSEGEDGEQPLNPMEQNKILGNLPNVMQLPLVKQCGLTEGEVIAIRAYTADNYKFINPATANSKDRPDENMLDLKKAKTAEEREQMAADIEKFKTKGWLDDKGRLSFENVGKELKSKAKKKELTKEELQGKTPLEIARLRLSEGDRKLLEQEEAEFAAAVKKYKKPEFMDDQMERGLGPRKISQLEDETQRKQEQRQFDEAYEAKKKDFYDKGSVHAAVLMQALKKLPPKKGKLYRGARMSEADFNSSYSNGKVVTIQSFQSNSTNESVADGFATGATATARLKDDQVLQVMCIIEVFEAREVKELSVAATEDELLLLPETKLVVTGITTKKPKEVKVRPRATKWITVNLKQQI